MAQETIAQRNEMTITEALSEVNLLKKKIQAKKEEITQVSHRLEHAKDPYEKDGGSATFIKTQLQGIEDLNTRLIKIRSAISRANFDTQVTIGKKTLSIHDWLVWKREVADGQIKFIDSTVTKVRSDQERYNRAPQVLANKETNEQKLAAFISNIDQKEFFETSENLHEIFETLDGQLSLKNATTKITLN